MAYPCNRTLAMIQTKPYTIPRPILSRIAALYYLRTFWPILLLPVLFGLSLAIFGPNRMFRFFGAVLAIWPATAFARSLLLVGKPAQAWAKPTTMSFDDEALYFESQTEPPSRLRLKRTVVRKLIKLAGFYLVQFRKFEFVPVPMGIFETPEEREEFERGFSREAVPVRTA